MGRRRSGKVKILGSGDITDIFTTPINVDYVLFSKPSDYVGYGNTSALPTSFSIEGYKDKNPLYTHDDTRSIGEASASAGTTTFYIIVAKGTYANIAAARAALAGKKLVYQKAQSTPVSLTGLPALDLEPGGTLQVETGVIEFRAHPDGGVLTIPDVAKPIISIDKVLKPVIQDGILHYEPITPTSNTATTITLPAGYSDATEYRVVYKTNPTPLPTVRYRYGVNLAAKAAATEGLAVQLSKELADFMAYQNVQNIMFDARLTALET